MTTFQLHDKTILTDKEIARRMINKLYPNITFNYRFRPIRITGPISLPELKLIIRLRPSIELRSKRTLTAYKRYGNIKQIQEELSKNHLKKTIIRLENNYPYNLQQPLKHYIAWCKGYTWKEIEEHEKLPFINNAKLYWINTSNQRSIT